MSTKKATVMRETEHDQAPVFLVPYEQVEVNKGFKNTRTTYEHIDELAEEIVQDGLQMPLLLREISPGKYELIAGFRRWKALELIRNGVINGKSIEKLKNPDLKTRVPCNIEKGLSNLDAFFMNCTENLSRDDVSSWELGAACARVQKEHGLSGAEISNRMRFKHHRSHINHCIKLRSLPKEILSEVDSGKLKTLPPKELEKELLYGCKTEAGDVDPAQQLAKFNAWKIRSEGGTPPGSTPPEKGKASNAKSRQKVAEAYALAQEWLRADEEDQDEEFGEKGEGYLEGFRDALAWSLGKGNIGKRKTALPDLPEEEDSEEAA